MNTRKNNVKQNRNLSVNMLSLTPHSEMNSTTTHGISELINELNTLNKKMVSVYRKNRKTLKRKFEQGNVISNRLKKTIKEVKETLNLIEGYQNKKHVRELKINKGKVFSKKRRFN